MLNRIIARIFAASCLLLFTVNVGHALTLPSGSGKSSSTPKLAEPALDDNPWEKWGVGLGGVYAKVESNVRLGTDVILNLSGEDNLNLDRKVWAMRGEAYYRFTKNRRHRLDATWFRLKRDGQRTLKRDIDITDVNGNVVTVPAGTNVSVNSELQMMELAYSYSFLQDARVDLAAVGGLYFMPVDFELSASDVGSTRSELNFTVPLPAIGFRMDAALTPQWFFRSGAQLFDVEFDRAEGYLIQVRAAFEYFPIYNVGFGLGGESMRVNLDKKSSDTGRGGEADVQYTGLQMYAKLRF